MDTYLVSGAAGFIAYRVCEMLLERGDRVIGIDNFCEDYDLAMKYWRVEQLNRFDAFSLYRGDVSEMAAVQEAVGGETVKAVINLAARAGVRASVIDPWVFVQTNMVGTLNLLEICRQKGIKKFILASTSSAYGENAPAPTPESADSSRPLQPYAASKVGAEAMCHAYHFLHGIDVTIFRYFTVYGPAGRPNQAMFRFVQWISEEQPVVLYGDGEQTRGFTYLDDIARGTIAGLQPLGYEVINLGGHEVVSVNALVQMMEEKIGKKANIIRKQAHPADMLTNQADVSKAKRLLGWQAETTLNEGVQALIDWYYAERDWAKQVKTL